MSEETQIEQKIKAEEPEKEWLLFAMLLNGRGGARFLSEHEIMEWKEEDGLLWLHLDLSAPKTIEFMENQSHIDPVALDILLEEEDVRPRTVSFGDMMMIFLRAVNLNPGEEPDDMIALRIWGQKNRLITLRETPLTFISELPPLLMRNIGPKTIGELLDEICSMTLDKVVEVVADLEDEIDGIEDNIIAETEDDELLPKLSEARRNLTEMRRYLSPQRDAMDVLPRQVVSWLDGDDRFQLRENANRMLRIVEDIDSLRERAMINMDELSNRVREETQENMYMLSVLAGIFIPLTFITGLFGMNVGGIPLGEHPQGFLISTVVLLAVGGLMAFIFKLLKWY